MPSLTVIDISMYDHTSTFDKEGEKIKVPYLLKQRPLPPKYPRNNA